MLQKAGELRRSIGRYFRRYSFLIGIIILVYLCTRIGITGYLLFTNESPTVKPVYNFPKNGFQERLDNTAYCWINNLSVGFYSFVMPVQEYYNFIHVIDSSYSNFNDQYKYGAEVVLGRLAAMSVHGVLEFVGTTLMVMGGVLFWISMISLLLSHRDRRFALKKSTMINMWEDMIVSIVFGTVLIVVAGPIEAFLSWPYLFKAFSGDLFYSIVYFEMLILLCVWIFLSNLRDGHILRKFSALKRS